MSLPKAISVEECMRNVITDEQYQLEKMEAQNRRLTLIINNLNQDLSDHVWKPIDTHFSSGSISEKDAKEIVPLYQSQKWDCFYSKLNRCIIFGHPQKKMSRFYKWSLG